MKRFAAHGTRDGRRPEGRPRAPAHPWRRCPSAAATLGCSHCWSSGSYALDCTRVKIESSSRPSLSSSTCCTAFLPLPMIVRDTLDNGIRLVTESMGHVRSVSLGVWLTSGSRHESEEDGG